MDRLRSQASSEDETVASGQRPPADEEPISLAGQLVDHFEIMRLLGRGGMGEVYLARDTKLGRKVALKMVRPDRLGSRAATEEFLLEARTTARFSHPNIVTVHAVGEHRGSPYVALEYLEGQDLRARMAERHPSLHESIRIMLAVASALVEAHRHGILHRDLKPRNVVFARDGRVRVVDFGIAGAFRPSEGEPPRSAPKSDLEVTIPDGSRERLRSEPQRFGGSPAYMAPEQWREEACTGAADIWALGVMLFELSAGRRPYEEASLSPLVLAVTSPAPAPRLEEASGVPTRLAELVGRCLQKDPRQRPTAAEVAAELEELLQSDRRHAADSDSPFRGLLPFAARHAGLFFGREAEIAAFVERVRLSPTLAVVGASGAGKSSFVRAGVVPRLREQERWHVLHLRPGSRPFVALAAALLRDSGETSAGESTAPARAQGRSATRSVEADDAEPATRRAGASAAHAADLGRWLAESPRRLSLELRALGRQHAAKVLLFVDQLEELFTLGSDEPTRNGFMEAICTAADHPLDPVRVVFAARDDFLGRLATGPEARDALANVTVIGSLDETALAQVLLRPLEVVGYRYEDPELVSEMVASVKGEPASLPLLQFAAQLLWDHRDPDRRLLGRSAYREMGGVEGALARHADGVLDGLSPPDLRLGRELLLRLVTPERTRRVVAEKRALEGLGEGAARVLDRLTSARLVSIAKSRTDPSIDNTVELAHESLIGAWGTLGRWIDESEEDLAFLAEVGQAAELWHKRGRREEEVWHGDALYDARRALARCTAPPPAPVDQFLEAGLAKERRTRRRRRAIAYSSMATLAAVAAISVVAAFAFAEQERETRRQKTAVEEQRRQTRREWAGGQREGARAALERGSLLEARAKLRGALEVEDSPLGRALWWRLSTDPLSWTRAMGGNVYDVAWSPDGQTIAAACQDRSIYLLDAVTSAVRVLRGHRDQILSVAFSPDGGRLASGGADPDELWLWDVGTGTRLRELKGHASPIIQLAFSPDGKTLASAGADASVRIWDAASGPARRVLSTGGSVFDVAFDHDGKLLATGGADGTVRVWEVASGAPRRVFTGHESSVRAVAFSPDGTVVASGGADRTVRLWDVASGAARRVLSGHGSGVFAVAFGPDGRLLASGGTDRTVKLWDVSSGTLRRTLAGHTDTVRRARFSPDGEHLATGSNDSTVRLWRLAAAGAQRRASGHGSPVVGAAFADDGKLLATGGYDGTVRLWDVATGAQVRVLSGHASAVNEVAFGAGGTFVAAAGEDASIRLWDPGSGAQRAVLLGHTSGARAVAASPDGRLLASAGTDQAIRLWDPAAGTARQVLSGHLGTVMAVAFSPDGKLLASGSMDESVRLWDVATGSLRGVPAERVGPVHGVAFSPDGKLLAYSTARRPVRVLQLGSGTSRSLGPAGGRRYGLAFHPDGHRLGVPSADGTASIWNLVTGESVLLAGHRSEVNTLRFSPDGKLAATTSDDWTVRFWETDSGRPYWRGPVMLPAGPEIYTHRGWIDLGVATAPPSHASTRWRSAIAEDARAASASEDGRTLCIRGFDDTVQLWDMAGDERLLERPLRDVRQVIATASSCVVLAEQKALLLGRSGTATPLAAQASAIGHGAGEILVATASGVLSFSLAGARAASFAAGRGATAVARVGPWLALGHEEGNIELCPTVAGTPRPTFTFEAVAASPVVSLLPGPMDTLIAGYHGGLVGIWMLSNGQRLDHAKLHGPVVHLRRDRDRLYVATELGDHLTLDLSVFQAGYCERLRAVWRQVPVLWQDGQPVRREPPADHECREH